MSSGQSDSLPTQQSKMPSLFIEIDNYDAYKGNYTTQNFSPGALEHSHSPVHISPASSICEYDDRVAKLSREIEILNNTITHDCSAEHISHKMSTGSSANIYKMSGNPNVYMKISNLPYDSYKLSKSNVSGIGCDTLGDKLHVSLNEINNSLKYEKLIHAFPRNIMRIEHAECCKKNYYGKSFIANKFLIEKVNGVTLNEALNTMTENELICCLIQLVYIFTYANMQGYFHNDITCDNIMIYYDVDTMVLNKLFLLDDIVICSFHTNEFIPRLPIVKLIDFSYSEYIDYSSQIMTNKVIVGEPQQIIKILKYKLFIKESPIYNSSILNRINALFNLLAEQNEFLKFKFNELNNNEAVTGFRTMTNQEIINMNIPKNFAEQTLLTIFYELLTICNTGDNYGVFIEITPSRTVTRLPKIVRNTSLDSETSKKLKLLEKKYKKYALATNKALASLLQDN